MLTDVSIRKTVATARRQEIPDKQTRGLYLIVQPTGAKSWAVRYSRNGRVLKTTLGPYPALSLSDARRQALQVAASVASGGDPQRDKMAKRAATLSPIRTVKVIVDEFLKRHTDEKSGKRWAAETRRILDRDVLPAIGGMAAADVGKAEIHDLLDPITDRGSPIAANRTLAVVKKLFRWSLGRGYVERDPCAGISKPGDETKRARVLLDNELARVWRAAEAMTYPFGPAVLLLILTGARREEVCAMRWSEVDFTAKAWTLPAARTKNGVEHVVPLSDAALSVLEQMPRIGRGEDFVFTTTGKTSVSGWSKAKAALDAACGVAGWTIHDLRRTFATGLAMLGVALPVVEKILNHISGSFGGVAGVYQRHAFGDEKRDALERWAEHIKAL
jgi:integrase